MSTTVEVAMKERPIIFGAESINSILTNCKTQTRRVIKLPSQKMVYAPWTHPKQGLIHGFDSRQGGLNVYCPYGDPGDQLWVRETFAAPFEGDENIQEPGGYPGVFYRANNPVRLESDGNWKSPIFMPRKFARITLEILSVRVQRLQEITFEDCLEEGIIWTQHWEDVKSSDLPDHPNIDDPDEMISRGWEDYTRVAFQHGWDALNAKRDFRWGSNPWVWVIEFKRMQP